VILRCRFHGRDGQQTNAEAQQEWHEASKNRLAAPKQVESARHVSAALNGDFVLSHGAFRGVLFHDLLVVPDYATMMLFSRRGLRL